MKTFVHVRNSSQDDDVSFVVKDIIQYKLGLEESKLLFNAHFQDDLGVDSLDLIELRMEIENKFSITVSDEESENLKTVGNLVDLIKKKNKGQ